MTIKNIIFIATNALGNRYAEATYNIEITIHLNKQLPVTFIDGIKDGENIPEQLN